MSTARRVCLVFCSATRRNNGAREALGASAPRRCDYITHQLQVTSGVRGQMSHEKRVCVTLEGQPSLRRLLEEPERCAPEARAGGAIQRARDQSTAGAFPSYRSSALQATREPRWQR